MGDHTMKNNHNYTTLIPKTIDDNDTVELNEDDENYNY